MKEFLQDVITLHQQVQELKVKNEKLISNNEKLASDNEEKDTTIQQIINQMVMSTLRIVSITLYGIVFLVLQKGIHQHNKYSVNLTR